MLARFRIGRTVFVGAFEVLEHELDGLQGKTVCKVVRQYGNVRFYAWVNTSKPVSAVTLAGTVMVNAGSTIEMVGVSE